MTTVAEIRQIQAQLAGREPRWALQADYEGAPASPEAGVSLANTIYLAIAISLREEVHRRTARVSITTLDLTATYTVTVDGHAVDYDADTASPSPSDAADVLQGIADAINADGTVGGLVTATAVDEDGDGTVEAVRLTGDAEADYTLDISATGSAVLACVADATTASGRLYLTARGQGALPTSWRLAHNGELGAVDYRGYAERARTSGCGRAYIELYDIAGPSGDGSSVTYEPSVWLGPGVAQ